MTDIRVRVGAVPFRNLQLEETSTFDDYGSRLWYAVTENMCSLNTFDLNGGGINIVNNLGEPQTTPASSAAFIVISPGPNKVGGYSNSGSISSACAGSADRENCRDVSIPDQTANITSTYRSQFANDGNIIANNYDDL